ILDHPCHAPHVSLDTAQADGGLGPDARAAMLEVDFGHRHEAPPPSFPPPLWGGVRSTYHHPWGFAMLSYRETPITCTSRAATVPSPLACPTITTRSLACSAAQDARKPWNRVVALMMMMRVPPVSRTTIRFGPRATTTPRQMMSLLKTGETARSLTSIARASSRPSSRRNPSTVTRSPRWIPQIAERANQSPSSPSTRVPRCTHTGRSSNPKRRARSDLKTRKRNMDASGSTEAITPSTVIRPTGAASRSLACADGTRQAAVTSTIGMATRYVRTGVTSTIDTRYWRREFRNAATRGPGYQAGSMQPGPMVAWFLGLEKRQRLPPSDPRISRPDAAADSRPRETASL